ncbi:MAG TPA: hypothetical protein VFH89_14410 [Sphingomicrobium sp.]|nr:hypothetical protein [Sphingomicrobium sp.]
MSDRAQLKLVAAIWAGCALATRLSGGWGDFAQLELMFASACYVASFFARRSA